MAKPALRKLIWLLEQEHAALLSGALDKIPAMTMEKETLLRQIPTSGAPARVLSDVSQRIARNQALLMAAQKGVKAAEEALGRLDQATRQSAFYDKSGTVSHMHHAGPEISEKL